MKIVTNDFDFSITPDGMVEKSKEINIWFRIKLNLGFIENVEVLFNRYNKPEGEITNRLGFYRKDENYAYFQSTTQIDEVGVYFFCIKLLINNTIKYIKYDLSQDTAVITTDKDKAYWEIAVGFDSPEWAKGSIMYHIFLDRFYRGSKKPLKEMPRRRLHKAWEEAPEIVSDDSGIENNDFFGGDLSGITEKLDYINSLGVSVIYISPIVKSSSNHRYDTGDYEEVDPYAGTNEDLATLCKEAHKRNMKIIIDGVFNHTGNDSKYFNEFGTYPSIGAYQSERSAYYNWYRKDKNGDFEYWWGMKNLPVCDGNNEEWQQYIYGKNGIIDKWFKLGIDGLRLDVADELTDDFIENIRAACKRNKEDSFIIGEVWKNPISMPRGYIKSGKGMDSVMNYQLADCVIRYLKFGDKDILKEKVEQILFFYPQGTLHTLMNFTSTHDISRIIDIFGLDIYENDLEWVWDLPQNNNNLQWEKDHDYLTQEQYDKGKQLLKIYALIMLFMPGIFSIFYGDEVGLQGVGNILNRKTFPWGNEDTQILQFFQEIGRLYNILPFLKDADGRLISVDENILMFERHSLTLGERAIIVINRTDKEQRYTLPQKYKDFPDLRIFYSMPKCDETKLSPYGATIFRI